MPTHFPNMSARELCQRIVDELVADEGLAWANAMSLDPVHRRLIFLASSGRTMNLIHRRVMSCDCNLAGLAVEERQVEWIDDITQPRADRRAFFHTDLISRLGLHSLCSIPILNSFNKHQDLLVLNLYPMRDDERVRDSAARKELSNRLFKRAQEFGECFERCLDEECHRSVNRLNATIGIQQDRPTLKTLCRLFARVARQKLRCDFVGVFTKRPQWDTLELQAWAEEIEPLRDVFFEIEDLAHQALLNNREELYLFTGENNPDWSVPPIVSRRRISALLAPIRSTDGTPSGIVVAVNFSPLDRNEEPAPLTYEQIAVIQAMGEAFVPRVELMYSEERKSMAMSRLAHEMRVPVSAFRAALEVIDLEMTQKRWAFRRPYLSDLESYARIMQWNVHELDLVRGAVDRLQMVAWPTFLESDVIQPAKRHVEAECQRRGFNGEQIKINPFKHVIPELHIDRDLMTHVVFNLLENAIKYAHPESELFGVQITPYLCHNGDFEIHFSDQGRGVPIGFEERIFQESFRHIDMWQIPGDGLGLFVARELVELHGGKLICLRKDKGAEFVIHLPYSLVEHSPTVRHVPVAPDQ